MTENLRNKNYMKVVAIAVVVLMFGSGLVSIGISKASGSTIPTELMERRTESSYTYLNPDGTQTLKSYSGVVNYRDSGNDLMPIDLDLRPSPASGYDLEVTKNSVHTYFVATPNVPVKVSLSFEGKQISFGPDGNPPNSVTYDRNVVTYRDVYAGNIDAEYSATSDGVKENLVLNHAVSTNTFTFWFDAPGMSVTSTPDGQVGLQCSGHVFATFSALMMIDAAGATSSDLRVEPKVISGQTFIEVVANPDWLTSPERAYPIKIDPTVAIETPDANFWTGWVQLPGSKFDFWYNALEDQFVGWAKFDLATLPTDITVTGLIHYGYVSLEDSLATVNMRGLLSDPEIAVGSTIATECTSTGTLYVTGFHAFPTLNAYVSTDLGSTAYSDIVAHKSQGWFAVGMEGTSDGNWGYWYGHSNANRPYIDVMYILLAPEIDASTLLLLPILLIFAVAVRSNIGRKR